MLVDGTMNAEFSGGGSLSDLLGKVDNLHDPVPILNKRPVTYVLVIFFLVSCSGCVILTSNVAGRRLTEEKILAAASAALRLYVRFRVTRCPGWDDLFIGLSMVRLPVLYPGTGG